MKKYEIIETTADIGIAAEGRDLPEVFSRAAAGMMSLITDPDGVMPREARMVWAQARDLEGLLAAWLNELLYLFETEDFIVKDCVVTVSEDTAASHLGLEAQVRGERVDKARHIFKTAIKAVTYHQLALTQVPVAMHGDVNETGPWQARVIFDV